MDIVIDKEDLPISYTPTKIKKECGNLILYAGIIFRIYATLEERKIAILWEDGLLVKCVLPKDIDIRTGEATVEINTLTNMVMTINTGIEEL